MNSIRDLENEDTLSNQICLERQLNKSTYIIVEGDFDEKIFSNFLNDECEIRIANGKDILDKSINELIKRGIDECFAIRDKDYDIFISPEIANHENIIFTDYKDLEMCILESEALSNVLNLYRINNTVEIIKNKVLDTILPIGYLRWLNEVECIGLDFKTTKIDKSIDKPSLTLNLKKYITALHQNTNRARREKSLKALTYTVDSLLINLKKFKSDNPDISMSLVCSGHDFISVLSISLMRLFANHNTNEVTETILSNNFILSYQIDYFKGTNMYTNFINKENTHNLSLIK